VLLSLSINSFNFGKIEHIALGILSAISKIVFHLALAFLLDIKGIILVTKTGRMFFGNHCKNLYTIGLEFESLFKNPSAISLRNSGFATHKPAISIRLFCLIPYSG